MSPTDYFPFPLTEGVYDTSPKMARLYDRHGRISDDMPEFVVDSQFDRYVENKLANLHNNQDRYRVCVDDTSPELDTIARSILALFVEKTSAASFIGSDKIYFLSSGIIADLSTGVINLNASPSFHVKRIVDYLQHVPMPMRLFDMLALHIQEDFAITARENDSDYLELAHICFPSHWSPQKKIGKSFAEIHQPVSNNAQLLKAHHTLVDSMIKRGPFTRFVWGIAFSNDLDRHPEHIRELGEKEPSPEQSVERAHLRVERQVTYPLPALERSLFTIRVFIKPLTEVAKNAQHRILLKDALLSMNDEAQRYKGLANLRDPLVQWLARQA